MTIKDYRRSKNKSVSNYIYLIIKQCLVIIILVFIVLIFSKNNSIKENIKKHLFETNLKYGKINSIYQKYIGLFNKEEKVKPVSNTNFITYKSKEKYLNGVKLKVDENYNVPLIESGIIVFIGEKEGYGKTVIIQQVNGIDVWYSNIDNISGKIYDYVEKGNIIGVSNKELIMVFQKNGEVVDYKNFII